MINPSRRIERAVEFADAKHLLYVAVMTEGGIKTDARTVAPYLDAFACGELEHVMQMVMDFHAALIQQLGRNRATKIMTDRVQALIGELELERAIR